ncbi:MAG: tRNA (adenosine(37)-N6)-threonylcarbamoyltransferase complex dimerization subunit type 1 TsaB [Deltaproteobacteria bacterium]|nr:tRNA (adenosine(37)-N6)-threonylcarbamoyltransferase complex dimerization subunit type 1 TsaB [Deltaproteobacteria bacterium]
MTSSAYSADPDFSVLAFDTSSPSGGIALVRGGRVVKERVDADAGAHSTWILGALKSFLEGTGHRLEDTSLFAVTIGPGSFTGIRIAVSTVKGMAWPLGRKVYGASTLRALARNIPSAGAAVCPLLDARKGEVYSALFRINASGGLVVLMDEKALSPSALFEEIERLAPGPVVFLGEGLKNYSKDVLERVKEARLAPEEQWRARASTVALMAFEDKGNAVSPELLAPVYLRKPGSEFKNASRSGKP